MKQALLGLGKAEIKEIITQWGHSPFRADQLHSYLWRGVPFEEMKVLPPELRAQLAEGYVESGVTILRCHTASDGTIKLLFGLQDHQAVEGVVMSYEHGQTLCLSTQAGCRMGCVFCASTIDGRARDLTWQEMLGQVVVANSYIRLQQGLKDLRILHNVVLMGSGEPLDNYDHTLQFLHIITSQEGLGLSARNISLSTCGIPKRMIQLADEGLPVTLCLSLHAPTDDLRKMIMPGAAKIATIDEVMQAARFYVKQTSRRLIIEYTLIEGLNDTKEMAKSLAMLLSHLQCHVNIIPLNPIGERDFKAPSNNRIHEFVNALKEMGISCTRRRTLGDEVSGACGQLKRMTQKAIKEAIQ